MFRVVGTILGLGGDVWAVVDWAWGKWTVFGYGLGLAEYAALITMGTALVLFANAKALSIVYERRGRTPRFHRMADWIAEVGADLDRRHEQQGRREYPPTLDEEAVYRELREVGIPTPVFGTVEGQVEWFYFLAGRARARDLKSAQRESRRLEKFPGYGLL
ncbi:MAG: hypothetical protein OXH50_12315 [Gemmatimonadetes bacterium]|nr:hypothetical protein [Gemmatimonadota bacterium]